MRPVDADVLLEYLQIIPIDLGYREVEEIEEYVKRMPTIEERKKGEWIIEDTLNMKVSCGSCGFVLEDWIQGALYRYCPNCGAEMEDPEDIPMEYFESGGR